MYVAVLVASVTLAACDSTVSVDDVEDLATESTELSVLADSLALNLGLSSTETQELHATMARHAGNQAKPGFLWPVAADLQQSLEPGVKAELFAQLEELEARRLAHGQCLTVYHDIRASLHRRRHDRPRDRHGRFTCVFRVMTEEQKALAGDIRHRFAEQVAVLRQALENGEITPDEFHAQVQELKEAMEAEILALLTEEQRAEVEACLSRDTDSPSDGPTDGPPRAFQAAVRVMAEVLGLSEEEVDALNRLHQGHYEAVHALRERLRNGEIGEDVFLAEIAELCRAYNGGLANILDDVQIEITDIHRMLVFRLVPTYLWPSDG